MNQYETRLRDLRSRPRRAGLTRGLLETARPRQWARNLLVAAPALTAGVLTEPDVAEDTAVAVVAFCIAASGLYLLNDALDVAADRRHPRKRLRPVAAGVVPPRLALAVGGTLPAVAVAVGWLLIGWPLAAVVLSYWILGTAYSVRLKHEPVLDLAVVAAGYPLRALAGGVAADVPLSSWFVVVTVFSALFVVAGKRYGETMLTDAPGGVTRPSLARYSVSYLHFIWTASATLAILDYTCWALLTDGSGSIWRALSIVPFTLGVLRYAVHVDVGQGDDPERTILADRVLQALGLSWLTLLAIGSLS